MKYDLVYHEEKFYGLGPYNPDDFMPSSKRINPDLALKIAHVTGAYWATRLGDALSKFEEAKRAGKKVNLRKMVNPYEQACSHILGHEIAGFPRHFNSPVVQQNITTSVLFLELAKARMAAEVSYSKKGLEEINGINYSGYRSNIEYSRKRFGEEAVDAVPKADEDHSYLSYLANCFNERVKPVLDKLDTGQGLEQEHIDIIRELEDDPRQMFRGRIIDGFLNSPVYDRIPNRYNKRSPIVTASPELNDALYKAGDEVYRMITGINNPEAVLTRDAVDAMSQQYLKLDGLIEQLPKEEREIVRALEYKQRWDLDRTLLHPGYAERIFPK